MDPPAQPVVFFDGDCGFCHASVRRLARLDRQGILGFAPLQGRLAARLIDDPSRLLGGDGSVALWSPEHDGEVRLRSAAVLAALAHVGAPWSWLGHLAGVPGLVALLDWAAYGPIARRRRRFGGANAACALPEPWLRERFLELPSPSAPAGEPAPTAAGNSGDQAAAAPR